MSELCTDEKGEIIGIAFFMQVFVARVVILQATPCSGIRRGLLSYAKEIGEFASAALTWLPENLDDLIERLAQVQARGSLDIARNL